MAKGISNETRSTTLKKFKPSPNQNGGICIGALTDVVIGTADIKADSGMETFRGLTVPRLNFVFESREDLQGVKPSTYILSYLPIEHTPESLITGKGGGAWRYEQMSQTIKHLLDVFREGKLFTKEEEAKLLIDFEDEKDGLFIEQPADVVVAAYEKFFNGVVELFKPEGKAIYKDANGKDKHLWIKLLLDIKGNLVNNGDYGFPGYPGEGLIELKRDKVPCSLSINIAKGENIIPKAPNTTAPTAHAGGPGTTTVDSDNIPAFMR